MEIYKGEQLALTLSGLGLPCNFVEVKTTPQTIKYYFDLNNVKDRKKINNTVLNLQTQLKNKIYLRDSGTISHFCIEFERKTRYFPHFTEVCDTLKDKKDTIIFGINEQNEVLTYELDKMPHLLVAGATGSGKSVFLNNVILNLILYNSPNDLKLVLIDPKQVEFGIYEKINNLYCPIITNFESALNTLNNLCDIMDKRYLKLKKLNLRNNSQNIFYKIVVIVDELADLMLTSKKAVETQLVRLAQKGRACGIHLILATQRPTVNVVTGLIKANIPCRIAFSMSSIRDSMVLLDYKGANELRGKGDALVKLPDKLETVRIQAPYISTDEILKIITIENTPKQKRKIKFKTIIKIALKILLFLPIWLFASAKYRNIKKQYRKKYINNFTINKLNFLDCIDDEF